MVIGFRAELTVKLDVTLGFHVMFSTFGHGRHRRPDQKFHKVRNLSLSSRNLYAMQTNKIKKTSFETVPSASGR